MHGFRSWRLVVLAAVVGLAAAGCQLQGLYQPVGLTLEVNQPLPGRAGSADQRLLLPSAISFDLIVLDAAGVQVAALSAPISAGTTQLNFSVDLKTGTQYTILGTASDSFLAAAFTGSCQVNLPLGQTQAVARLYLVPADPATYFPYSQANPSITVPMNSTATGVVFLDPVYVYSATFPFDTLPGGVSAWLQNEDGSPLLATGLQATASTTILPQQTMGNTGKFYITFYNSSAAGFTFSFPFTVVPLSAGSGLNVNITFTLPSELATVTGAPSQVMKTATAPFVVNANGAFTSYQWRFDGGALPAGLTASGSLLNINPAAMTAAWGAHEVALIATDSSGQVWSARFTFNFTN